MTYSLDVREFSCIRRHDRIYGAFDDVDLGNSFVLINDHAPNPIYYQLLHERPVQFDWEYFKHDSQVWRVAMRRKDDDGGTK